MHATEEDIAELLGPRAEESIVERIASTGASIDEVREAFEDLEFQARFAEERPPTSPAVEEVRAILEEMPYFEELAEEAGAGGEAEEPDQLEDEGLTLIEPEELQHEA